MKHSVIGHAPRALALLALSALLGAPAYSQTLSTLMYFNGSRPTGGVTLGSNNALYGAASESTFRAGATVGLLYRLRADASQIETIHQFGRMGVFVGGGPRAALTADGAGNFYGVTAYTGVDSNSGRATGGGIVFKITEAGVFTRLYSFSEPSTDAPFVNADGAAPNATLLLGSDGYLYGSTTDGGANGAGTLFKVSTDGSGFTVLHTFAAVSGTNPDLRAINADGVQPQRLTLASNGDLYGVTNAGGVNGTGVLFRLRRDGSNFAVLKTFDPSPDTTDVKTNASGAYPSSALLAASNGYLYGTTFALGANGYGNVFRIALDGSGYTVMKSFDLASSGSPSGDLIVANDGTIVGTTASGGAIATDVNGAGAIYSLSLDGTAFTPLYIFPPDAAAVQANGASPNTGVVQAADGSFYGTTGGGSPYGLGTIFKFGAATNRTPLGNPEPYDDGGAISWWLLAALLALIAAAQLKRSRVMRSGVLVVRG